MELQNTLENKAKFFAQYWGQAVIQDVDNSGVSQIYPVVQSNMYRFEESILLLKPLSSITDEDLELLVPIVQSTSYHGSYLKPNMVKQIFNDYLNKGSSLHGTQWWQMKDFLRSKGYALPYNGLSVEKQIEYGWVKLATS